MNLRANTASSGTQQQEASSGDDTLAEADG